MTPFLYFFLGALWLGLVEALLVWWWRLEQRKARPPEPRYLQDVREAAGRG